MQMKQLIWRLPTALLGGLVGLYVFPTENVWILAPLVPGLILLATLGTGFWVATTIGFLAGLAIGSAIAVAMWLKDRG